ncbi:MAG: hypothetical protein Q8L37_00725 [Candidatus Gottesmanbacteria bacterium]|nr:hypothetical protein [Candidatus Gottesmanbacteria bacterium]
MVKRVIGDAILIVVLLLFSWWLMAKSFGYDAGTSQFRIARHEVGDFGLHISLIRSFASGQNRGPESPFFPGRPLVYHYAVDWLAGLLVRIGIRIDFALNGISALALTILLYGLYRLAILFSNGKKVVGLLSIVLFVLPGNLSFIDILREAPKNFSFFSYFWRFPDYIHKGPFDGSVITIYSTLAPYLNQRHLIAGMAIAVWVIWMIVGWSDGNKRIPDSRWIIVGLLLGAATRVHVVVAASTGIMVMALLLGKRNKALILLVGTAFLVAIPHLIQIISMRSATSLGQLWNPGYLAPQPLSWASWIMFWIYNLGIFVILIPCAYRLTSEAGRRLLIGAGLLFLIANTVQISYRIEHNHSLINFATALSLPFIAHLIVSWWQKRGIAWRILTVSTVFLSITSGLFNLMVVKNDYQLIIDDAPKNRFMQWITTKTDSGSVFIAEPALYDPVVLTGRKNYLGHEYYVSVMGYDYWSRRKQIDTWLTSFNQNTIAEMKKHSIRYVVIPKERKDFQYTLDNDTMDTLARVVYRDESVSVYEL